MKSNALILILTVTLMAGFSTGIAAQEKSGVKDDIVTYDDLTKEKMAEKEAEGKPDGWHFTIKAGSSFSFNDNRQVVSQPHGFSLTLGMSVEGIIELRRSSHEWRNIIKLAEGVTRTPIIDKFVIAADSFNYETMYLYVPLKWFGVYVRFVLDTSFFEGIDYRPADVQYVIDGDTANPKTAKELKLTDSFLPLTLKQGVGPFFRPVEREPITLEIMLGFGARQTFADDQLALADDDKTEDFIEIKTLQTVKSVGGEGMVKLWGDLVEKRIAYSAGVEVLMPFYNDPEPTTLSGIDLLYVDTNVRFDFKIVEWMSLVYEFKALKDPLIINEWQIQNNLLLTIGYTLYKHVDG
jgi:hypothetical protein